MTVLKLSFSKSLKLCLYLVVALTAKWTKYILKVENLLDFTHPNRARHVSTNIYIYCLFWFQFCSLCNASEQRQKDDISPVYIHQIGDSFEANQTLNRSLFFIFYCPALFFLVCVPSFIKKEYLPRLRIGPTPTCR